MMKPVQKSAMAIVCTALICGGAGVCVPFASVIAQTITPVQEMSFGKFALKNNSSAHMLRVARTGGVTADSAYIVMDTPVPAEYTLAGFTPSTPLTVSIPDSTLTAAGTGDHFDLRDFTPTPGLTTDGAGGATLRFGASLYTSGSGTNYIDGAFSGDIDITVDY